MHHMGLDCAMEDVTPDEAEVPVNSACSTLQERPSLGRVVRDWDICMLKERYRDCTSSASSRARKEGQHTNPVVRP
jgi:hypothetical protein